MTRSMLAKLFKFFNKVRRRLGFIYFRYVKHSGRKIRQYDRIQKGEPHILIIAPGEMAIPNDGWGAVEIVTSAHINEFRKLGFGINLLNSWYWRDWIKTFWNRPQVILLHYDAFARRTYFLAKILRVPSIVISHFGYAAFEDKWNLAYSRNIKWLSKHDIVIALSPQIKEVLSKYISPQKIRIIPNAAEINNQDILSPRSGFICLGKIEERKMQKEILESVDGHFSVDFVGPVAISGFKELVNNQENANYLGTWTRAEVLRNLPKYKSLILLSDGEADALVLYEAQQAGLHIIVSPQALGSQNSTLPWVHVCDDLSSLNMILRDLSSSDAISSGEIVDFARKNLTWESRGKDLGKLLLDLSHISK